MLPLCITLSFCFAESCDYSRGKQTKTKKAVSSLHKPTARLVIFLAHLFGLQTKTLAIFKILAARKCILNTAEGSGAACAADAGSSQARVPSFYIFAGAPDRLVERTNTPQRPVAVILPLSVEISPPPREEVIPSVPLC